MSRSHDWSKRQSCSRSCHKNTNVKKRLKSSLSSTPQQSEVSGHLHAPSTLCPGKHPSTHTSHTNFSLEENWHVQGTVHLYKYLPPGRLSVNAMQVKANPRVSLLVKAILAVANTNACHINQPWKQHDNCSLSSLYNEQSSEHLSNTKVVERCFKLDYYRIIRSEVRRKQSCTAPQVGNLSAWRFWRQWLKFKIAYA